MSDPGWPLQQALFAVLEGALDVPVYDSVPADAAYPYVTIDAQMVLPDDPLTSRRDDRRVYLNVWSTYQGQKEVLEIMAAIDAALAYRRSLPMESGRLVRIRVVRKDTRRDADNVTYMGRVTLQVLTEH